MSFDEIHEGKHYRVLLRNQDGWFKEASSFPHGVIASDYPRTQSSDRDQEIMRSFGKCVGWKVPRVCILEVRDCLQAHRNGSATRPESNPSIHMGFFHSLFKFIAGDFVAEPPSTVSQPRGRRQVTRQQKPADLGLPGVGASLVSVLVQFGASGRREQFARSAKFSVPYNLMQCCVDMAKRILRFCKRAS